MGKKHPKKLKNTKAGKRAIESAKKGESNQVEGVDKLEGGSIKTATIDLPGQGRKGKRTDVAIVPTVKEKNGRLVSVSPKQSLAEGDYAVVRGGKSLKKIEAARKRGDNRSKKFSNKLGKIAQKGQ